MEIMLWHGQQRAQHRAYDKTRPSYRQAICVDATRLNFNFNSITISHERLNKIHCRRWNHRRATATATMMASVTEAHSH